MLCVLENSNYWPSMIHRCIAYFDLCYYTIWFNYKHHRQLTVAVVSNWSYIGESMCGRVWMNL